MSGLGKNINPANFEAVVLHSDMKRTGFFKCGHEKINKLYSNTIWGQRDNFLDIPTDCPQGKWATLRRSSRPVRAR